MKPPNRYLSYLVLSLLLLFIIHLIYSKIINNRDIFYKKEIKKIEKVIHNKNVRLEQLLNELISYKQQSYKILFSKYAEKYPLLYNDEGIGLFIYEDNSLKFWTTNSISVSGFNPDLLNDDSICYLNNGWYFIKKSADSSDLKNINESPASVKSKTYLGLFLLKSRYEIKNKFLPEEWQNDFHLTNDGTNYTITQNFNNPTDFHIKSKTGKYLFSVTVTSDVHQGIFYYAIFLLFLLIVIVFIYSLQKIFKLGLEFRVSGFRFQNFRLFLFILIIIILRILSIFFHYPHFLGELSIFNPKYYASSLINPSLGDLLINTILILYFSYLIYKFFRLAPSEEEVNLNLPRQTWIIQYILTIILMFILFILSQVLVYFIQNLIYNSSSLVMLDLTNISDISFYTIIGFVIIGIMLFSYYLLVKKGCYLMNSKFKIQNSKSKIFFTILISTVLFIIFQYYFFYFNAIVVIFSIIVIISLISFGKKEKLNFSDILFLLLVFVLFTTYFIQKSNVEKEKENRILLASRLSAKNDPDAEYLFINLEKQLFQDTTIQNYLYPDISQQVGNTEAIEDSVILLIQKKYLKDYWEKYDNQINICRPDDSLFIVATNEQIGCFAFFDNLIQEFGKPTYSKNLWFLDNESGRISYLAILPFKKQDHSDINIYIELNSKFVTYQIGFPEILQNENISSFSSREISNYSYARYKEGQLFNTIGDYRYNVTSREFEALNPDTPGQALIENREYFFTKSNSYNHLVYNVDKNNIIILSKKTESILNSIATFSYLFAFFGIFLVIFAGWRIKNYRTLLSTFKNKIQFSFITILMFSLILIATGTIYYFIKRYNQQNQQNISEKVSSVLIEMEHKFGNYNNLTQQMAVPLSNVLAKFSNIFFTDINLYDLEGNIIASSRPEIFERSLISSQLNNIAYKELIIQEKSEFIHTENIGKMKFLSAYVPFRNNEDKLLAYLNLSYFAKQISIRKEISTVIVAIINIYILLIIMSIIVTVIVTNRLTNSLILIQKSMRNIKLGMPNEKIQYRSTDEIGNLITEYNRMIDELTHSAELLARSERENAWREMAKQVAHEIKNPLTPMKLTTQYIQQSYKKDDPEWETKLQQFTKILIQQIDTLSNIATEFSNFAKLPTPKLEKTFLNKVITDAILLFNNYKHIKFYFETDVHFYVLADAELLLRALNNLLKNAVQAIEASENANNGIIIIKVLSSTSPLKDSRKVLLSISDNGVGIPENQANKIFTPNFTTKTSGMGLGLAITKGLIESMNGKISFSSKIGKGTTFYVQILQCLS